MAPSPVYVIGVGMTKFNPSGGLISKGHPLGATGLAQAAELVWQLRGWAGDRGVPGVDVALQHNLGLGGAAVVSVYKRADGGKGIRDDTATGMIGGRGYNPAVEARGVTSEEIENVVSKKARSGWIEGKRSLDSRL
jgi:sterol carrier protein 2